jgi:hypothetical protein
MTNSRPPINGRDVAGAGMLLLTVNLVCAGIGAGLGALIGATVPLLLAGFFIGFFLGIYVVSNRFRNI